MSTITYMQGSIIPMLPAGKMHPLLRSFQQKEKAQEDLANTIFNELFSSLSTLKEAIGRNTQLRAKQIAHQSVRQEKEAAQLRELMRLQQEVFSLSSEVVALERQLQSILERTKKSEIRAVLNEVREAQREYYQHRHTVPFYSPGDALPLGAPSCDYIGVCTGRYTTKYYPQKFEEIPGDWYEC